MSDGFALLGRIRQEVDRRETPLIELRVADVEFDTLLRQSVERAFEYAASVRARPQKPARIVQLEIQQQPHPASPSEKTCQVVPPSVERQMPMSAPA